MFEVSNESFKTKGVILCSFTDLNGYARDLSRRSGICNRRKELFLGLRVFTFSHLTSFDTSCSSN